MSASAIASRPPSTSSSSRRSPEKPTGSIVARSVPLPLTLSTRIERPVWSVSSSFDDVFPPPQLAIRRSAPSRLER